MISILQDYSPKDFGGTVTKVHLGQAHMLEPQKSLPTVQRVHQLINGSNDLNSMLMRYPKIELDTDNPWYWDLMGDGTKNVPLVRASLTSGGSAISATDKTGVANSDFYLIFPENYFGDVDVIWGHKIEYQVQILEEPVSIGSEWEYHCKLITGDPALFIPYDELQSGKRFSDLAPYIESTLSKKGGRVNYTSPFRMRNFFTHIRMEDTRPTNMVFQPMAVRIPKSDGTYTDLWQDYADWQFDKQYMEKLNRAMYYSRINKTAQGNVINKGKSGFELAVGAGLRQQIESANVGYYPVGQFSIPYLKDILVDLTEGKLTEDERFFTLRTGTRGFMQFDEAVQDYSNLFVRVQDTNRIDKIGNNNLRFSGQFTEYYGPAGIKVRVELDPIKDDKAMHKELAPNGGTAESLVYDIIDMGTVKGEGNIRKVVWKGNEDIKVVIPGLYNPMDKGGKGMIVGASPIDGYQIHRKGTVGVQVTDPTRCCVLKPNILA